MKKSWVDNMGILIEDGEQQVDAERFNHGHPNVESNKARYSCVSDQDVYKAPREGSSLSSEDDADVGHTRCWPYLGPRKRPLRKARTAPAISAFFKKKDKFDRPELQTACSIVLQASVGLSLYLSIGVLVYMSKRDEFSGKSTLPLVDALYFCIVTLCTIGYGDIAPLSSEAKLFSCAFVLVGFGFIDILLSWMVAYVLEQQEAILIGSVVSGHHETTKRYLVNTEEGRVRLRMKVALALWMVIVHLGIGTLAMHELEELNWVDAFYLSCMSVTTVGYGDHSFKTLHGRIFAVIWLLISTLIVARSFLFLAEARIYHWNRSVVRWALQRQVTLDDVVTADLHHVGHLSKSEYVLHKLKEMGKIKDKDLKDVSKQFELLDSDNSGRITLSCLTNTV